MHNQNSCEQGCHCNTCCVSCVSWSGIIVAALIAVGLSFLLNLFATSIGLAAFTTSAEGVVTLAVGGYIGMLIGIIAVMYFVGWIAGHLGRKHSEHACMGALNGLAAWALALVLMVFSGSHMTGFVAEKFEAFTNHKAAVAHVIENAPVKTMVATKVNNGNVVATKMNNTNVAATKANNTKQTVVSENTINKLGKSLLLVFVLFFVGALSSVMGGWCGAKCKGCDKTCNDKTCNDKTCN